MTAEIEPHRPYIVRFIATINPTIHYIDPTSVLNLFYPILVMDISARVVRTPGIVHECSLAGTFPSSIKFVELYKTVETQDT